MNNSSAIREAFELRPQQFDMDLSLAPTTTTSSDQEQDKDQELTSNIGASTSSGTGNSHNLPMMMIPPREKEHMFDKVVTPSDVGKLNRLVIPKQHAERYFPLDSSNNQNGTLLNFQDRNGKMWRFRYSYWNSSQSYVMTKGWSRFVKEKKLDAGDIVSFQRGIGDESERSKLYIDWRHRPDMSLVQPHQFGNFGFNFNFPTTSQHSNRFHPLPEYNSVPIRWNLNIGNHQRSYYNNQRQELVGYGPYGYGNFGRCYYTGSPLDQRNIIGSEPYVIESVPVVPGRLTPVIIPSLPQPPSTAGKRLRLFGVNMECGNDYNQQQDSWILPPGELGASSSSSPALRLNLSPDHDDNNNGDHSDEDDQYAKKGKSSFSLNFNP